MPNSSLAPVGRACMRGQRVRVACGALRSANSRTGLRRVVLCSSHSAATHAYLGGCSATHQLR